MTPEAQQISDAIDKFRDDVRAGAIADAARAVEALMGDYEQGILEQVNSGDRTMNEIYPELRQHAKLTKRLLGVIRNVTESA